jgi:hypothetical protein
VAIDVAEVLGCVPMVVERMLTPGAARWTDDPKLENDAERSVLSVAATAMTFAAE